MFFLDRISISFLWIFAAALLQPALGRHSYNAYPGAENNTTTLGSSGIPPPLPFGSSENRACSAPPQPEFGEWKLHPDSYVIGVVDGKVSEGTELKGGSQLIYSCRAGYTIEKTENVFCTAKGDWSFIPSCREIRCEPLNTVSRIADCSRSRERVNCTLPALPRTSAKVFCRPGYRKDTSVWLPSKNDVDCNDEGEWVPQPISCLADCGRVATASKPLSINGWNADIVEFPWHVTLYMKSNASADTKRKFICGGTIIQANLVMTAAHCVFDESSRTKQDPQLLSLMAGNTFRDWDHPMHNPEIVRRAEVRQVYTYFDYYGLSGNYNSDIALLELQTPFVLSKILLPACLDTSGTDAPYLESGSIGKLAGFGITVTGESSPILQTISVPYVSYADCKVSKNVADNEVFITKDKFCAGHTNGSAVCDGDSGGGLMFKANNGKWYVMGIVSVSLGVDTKTGTRMCDRHAYTVYTKVGDFADWILERISNLRRLKQRPSSNPTPPPSTRSPTSTTMSRRDQMFTVSSAVTPSTTRSTGCLLPPQPSNGQWRLRPWHCRSLGYADDDCKVPPGFVVEFGIPLIYSCDVGYKVSGNTQIYCVSGGNWTEFPQCISVKCSPLASASIVASCVSESGDIFGCDSPALPMTKAILSCRPGYTRDTSSTTVLQSDKIVCNPNGKWEPDPIKCTPACGQVIPRNMNPLVVNGTVAQLGEFPWHASVYVQIVTPRTTKTEFRCGATIIKSNYLLTVAHCIYDERSLVTKDFGKLLIIAGNLYRDSDSPLQDSRTVQTRVVQNVSIPCEYNGASENYASDIALLELKEPLDVSSLVLPACLDFDGSSATTLGDGDYGKISGFGRTATYPLSGILRTITVPYVSDSACRKAAGKNEAFVTADKFCAGYNNGSAICDGDTGGGLAFRKNDKWFVLGIASVGFGRAIVNGEVSCDTYSYALYTAVSNHMRWIQDVIFSVERNNSIPYC